METFPSLAKSRLFNLISNWRQVGEEIQKKDEAVYGAYWGEMKQKVLDGAAPHSWGKAFVQSNYESQGMDELGAIYTAYCGLNAKTKCSGTMIEAGSETTSQTLNNCIVGLLSNPEAVKLAHEELDRVIGTSRPPNYSDEPNLPFIRAIVKVHCRDLQLISGNSPMETSQQIRPKPL